MGQSLAMKRRMGGGVILSFPSLALSRSGSEGISHPRIAMRFAGPLAFATLRQPDDYNRALNFYQHILLATLTAAVKVPPRTIRCLALPSSMVLISEHDFCIDVRVYSTIRLVAFAFIHGIVRHFYQILCIVGIFRCHSNANTDINGHLDGADIDGA